MKTRKIKPKVVDFVAFRLLAPRGIVEASLRCQGMRIAVCFVGQFIRHATLQESISTILGPYSYSAFIASSTQQVETNSDDKVNGTSVCADLIFRGFESCRYDLIPYDARLYADMMANTDFQRRDGLLSFRSLSLFSTISRCVSNVRAFEESERQDFVATVVTRLDVISKVHVVGGMKVSSPDRYRSLWGRALKYDVIGSKKVAGMFDDRFFLGRYVSMMNLEV